jgi:hypothetical protein
MRSDFTRHPSVPCIGSGQPFTGGNHARPLTPAVLDCMAGIELQHGHHVRAEYLAQLANDMREAGR